MTRIQTFERQRALRAKLKERTIGGVPASRLEVDALLALPIDEARLASMDVASDFVVTLAIPPHDARNILKELERNFNAEQVDRLLDRTQNDLIRAIAVPFGLGKIVSLMDKEGGFVDSVHNARQNIYATEKEKVAYEKRGEYKKRDIHKDPRFQKVNRRHSAARKSGGISDAYVPERILGYNDDMNTDHVISAKQTHDDRARVLANIPTEDLANITENLVPTDQHINGSKGAKTPEEFHQHLDRTRERRITRLYELSGKEESLTDRERKEFSKLKSLDQIDLQSFDEKAQIAQNAQDRKINRKYYTSKKFCGNMLKTSLTQGALMGGQQAFGLLLIELFQGLIDEARDAFCNGVIGESLLKDLRIRFKRVVSRVIARWKDALKAMRMGGLSGFLSNLVTTIINVFITTSVRAVRMIREGVFSLLKAVKTALFPRDGTTSRDACHEALKILAAGGIVIGGVVLEEAIEKIIMSIPILVPIASLLTAVIVGSVTAMAMALAAYLVDRLDLLRSIRLKRDQYVVRALDNEILKQCMGIAEKMAGIGNLTKLVAE